MSVPQRDSRPTTHVVQGGMAVGRDPGCVLGTILGSCVSACLWDPGARIGGMNHIVLPERAGAWSAVASHGAAEMERLIDALVRAGASRDRLRAKVFGGARMIPALPDIGGRNAEFLIVYLARAGIPIDSSSLGGDQARMIRFWPHSGRARQRLVDRLDDPVPAPRPVPGAEVFLVAPPGD